MIQTKLLTLILTSNTYPSIRNMSMQKKILINQEANSNNMVFWYRGAQKKIHPKKYIQSENDIFIDADDTSLGMGIKTIYALEWALENVDFQYLLRTNTSSYVQYKNMDRFIDENFTNSKYVYSGLKHETTDLNKNKIEFASGSGFLLNKKTVELILNNQDSWDHRYWDDVSLALLLKNHNIYPMYGKRFDIEGNLHKQEVNPTFYHYRCKANDFWGYPRFIEKQILNSLHKKITLEKNNQLFNFIQSTYFELLRIFYVHQFGWKVYSFIRKLSKTILPKKLYKLIKKKLKNRIKAFKLVRFKI